MAKEKVKPFTSVESFNKAMEAYNKLDGLLKANLKFLTKKFGEGGGTYPVNDGNLILTAKTDNGKDSVSYANMVKAIETKIRVGELHRMGKDDLITWIDKVKTDNTKPQKTKQVVLGKIIEKQA